MNITERLNGTMRRVHKNFTKELTVYNYSWDDAGGSNAYADGDWIESSTEVEGSVRLADEIEYDDDVSGENQSHNVDIWIAPDEASIVIDGGDETRATEFVEAETGRRYRAVGFHDESSLYRIECREVE